MFVWISFRKSLSLAWLLITKTGRAQVRLHFLVRECGTMMSLPQHPQSYSYSFYIPKCRLVSSHLLFSSFGQCKEVLQHMLTYTTAGLCRNHFCLFSHREFALLMWDNNYGNLTGVFAAFMGFCGSVGEIFFICHSENMKTTTVGVWVVFFLFSVLSHVWWIWLYKLKWNVREEQTMNNDINQLSVLMNLTSPEEGRNLLSLQTKIKW